MSALHTLFTMVRADFLERVRRSSFILLVGLTIFVGFKMVPANKESYNAFVIGGTRGLYNSSWIGTVFGVMSATLLSLFGFYLVNNAIKRDYQTKVGQIIAATFFSKPIYMLSKWLSNLLVLSLILGVLSLVAPIMQIIRSEDMTVKPWALLAPIWFIGLPSLAIVSALSVLFETIPFLRGSFGSVIFFFTWIAVLMLSAGQSFISINEVVPKNDVLGLSHTLADIQMHMLDAGLNPSNGTTDILVPTHGREVTRFTWNGLDWTCRRIGERLFWIGAALLITLAAALLFDRFDPASSRIQKRDKHSNPHLRLNNKSMLKLAYSPIYVEPVTEKALPNTAIQLLFNEEFRLPKLHKFHSWPFVELVASEFRLMLKEQTWWWYAVTIGLNIACLFSPLEISVQYLLPAMWLWPITVWSSLGNREWRYQTQQIVFTTPYSGFKHVSAAWLSGILVTLLTVCGAVLKCAIDGEIHRTFVILVGSSFIPALALSTGVWSHGPRLFEITYLVLWYGNYADFAVLDFMGTHSPTISIQNILGFIAITCFLYFLSVIGRQRPL